MTVTKEKVRAATPEQRQKAVKMVALGATLREAAAAVGVSHQTMRAIGRRRPERSHACALPPLLAL